MPALVGHRHASAVLGRNDGVGARHKQARNEGSDGEKRSQQNSTEEDRAGNDDRSAWPAVDEK